MNMIFQWIRSLVFYLILMTMVINLLPDKKYEKYLRLFTGMVLVLVVFEPLADLGGIEDKMAGAFSRITFQNDARLLQREIADADGKRMEKLISGYEAAVENDLRLMAEGGMLECREVEAKLAGAADQMGSGSWAEIGSREGAADWADAASQAASASWAGDEEPAGGGTQMDREAWAIAQDRTAGEFGSLGQVNMVVGIAGGHGDSQERRLAANREIARLKTRIGEYYGVEEGKITIYLETE